MAALTLDPQQSERRRADGVILAAGLSTRSRRFKMALPLGDKSVIERAVKGMLDLDTPDDYQALLHRHEDSHRTNPS